MAIIWRPATWPVSQGDSCHSVKELSNAISLLSISLHCSFMPQNPQHSHCHHSKDYWLSSDQTFHLLSPPAILEWTAISEEGFHWPVKSWLKPRCCHKEGQSLKMLLMPEPFQSLEDSAHWVSIRAHLATPGSTLNTRRPNLVIFHGQLSLEMDTEIYN